MKNVLVTGATGFVGQHLVRELSENGYNVIGIGGPQADTDISPYIKKYIEADLTDATAVAAIDFRGVDGIFHLAGLAAVGPSFDEPLKYLVSNMGMEVNIFEAALAQKVTPRIVIISSGSLYAQSADLPLTETSVATPNSPYAVSKLGQEQMAQYYSGRGFETIIARPFNHIGPGQNLGFLIPDLTSQVIATERRTTGKVLVGNLDAKRDYTDVRDIARAYRLLLTSGIPGETYNVCSGVARSGHEMLSAIVDSAQLDPVIEQDQARMRPSDSPVIYGSHQKLTADTGWEPTFSLRQTIDDVVADWRSRP